MPLIQDPLAGDDMEIAQLIAAAGRLAAGAQAPYSVADVMLERRQELGRGRAFRRFAKRPAQAGRTRRIVVVTALVALGVAIPVFLHRSSPAIAPYQAASRLLPRRTPLDDSLLIAPAGGRGSMSGGRGAQTFIDPATGTSRSVSLFGSNTQLTYPWVGIDGEVIAVNGLQDTDGVPQVGTAEVVVPSEPPLVKAIGRATYVVQSDVAGGVWLVVNPDMTPDTGCTVEEVTLTAGVLVRPRPYPCSWTIAGSAPSGLLVQTGGQDGVGRLSVWDPRSGLTVRSFGQPARNIGVDGDNGHYVLWNECAKSPCVDSISNLATGQTRALPPLPNTWLANSSYVLSPDGNYVAVIAISQATQASLSGGVATSPPCCYYGVKAVSSEIFLYSVAGDNLIERRPLVAASDVLARWSTDSGYFFVTRDLESIDAVPLWSSGAPIKVISVGDNGIGPDNPAESFIPLTAPPTI
jgi:hypothetical protein